jgi:hypothetical protein
VGRIYFLLSGRYVKIGWTSGLVEDRRRKLQTGSPQYIGVMRVEEGKTKADELALHRRFKELRRQGEWFTFGDALEEYIYGAKAGSSSGRPGRTRCPAYWDRLDQHEANMQLLRELRDAAA